MAVVPTSYRFIKESNGNVLVNAYDGVTLLGILASLNPAKSLSRSERYPEQVVIPIDVVVAHANNKFLSIPFSKIDLANSTPANTNPTSASDAIDKLQTDFFFDVGGGGGGVGTLQQVTDAGDTTTNDIVMDGGNLVLNDDSIIQFNNAAGPFFSTINNSQVTANRQAQLPDADGSIALITGTVNTNPSNVDVEVKIPIAIIDGTVYYVLASTNNT